MKFQYNEEIMKEKIIFTTSACTFLIIFLLFIDAEFSSIIALIVGILGLITVTFMVYTENKLGKIEFVIANKALVVIYHEKEFWIFYDDMQYIKETNFGLNIGLLNIAEELVILNKMDNYQDFICGLFAKAKEYDIPIEKSIHIHN